MRFDSIERLRKSNRLLLATACVLGSCCVIALVFGAGCTTAPTYSSAITQQERAKSEQRVGANLAKQFESTQVFKQDKEVMIYLHDLAMKLTAATLELSDSSVGVLVVADRGARWRDYSMPGNRVYLSSGLLKRIEFENELAAAIALELAHILKRHVLSRLQEGRISSQAANPANFPSIEGLVPSSSDGADKEADFFSPTGIYAYPDEYFLESVDSAVGIIYSAGFDPRGLVSLWELYRGQKPHSPFEDDLLRKLLDKTRTIIAQHSPLRNPIVRSQAFLSIQKRIQKL